MLCKIAELIVDLPEAGGMAPRCQAYLYDGDEEPDVAFQPRKYRPPNWPSVDKNQEIYLDACLQFYAEIVYHNGMMLHSSAVTLDNRAYLFSAPGGTGKSTHTKLWQQNFGEAAQILNDDKPALRKMDGKWYAYGTPWSGKFSINQNRKVPLAGICFIKRGAQNEIRRLSQMEAINRIISQTRRIFYEPERVEKMLENVEMLTNDVPIFELHCNMDPEAAMLSYITMCKCAEGMGL